MSPTGVYKVISSSGGKFIAKYFSSYFTNVIDFLTVSCHFPGAVLPVPALCPCLESQFKMVLLTNNFCWTVLKFFTQFARHFITERPHFLKISYYNYPFLAYLSPKDPFLCKPIIYHWRHLYFYLYVTEGSPPPSLGHSIHWNEWIFHFKLIKFNFKQFINFMQFFILTTNV